MGGQNAAVVMKNSLIMKSLKNIQKAKDALRTMVSSVMSAIQF